MDIEALYEEAESIEDEIRFHRNRIKQLSVEHEGICNEIIREERFAEETKRKN